MRRKNTFRLQSFDYRNPGHYFVTICTVGRRQHFGACHDGSISLSSVGEIVEQCWMQIAALNPHILLDEFIVMPNHLHGILFFHEGKDDSSGRRCTVNSLTGSLASAICGFKSAVTRQAHSRNFEGVLWQRKYYEHIIRSEAALLNLRKYIQDNPVCWYLDELNPDKTRRWFCRN